MLSMASNQVLSRSLSPGTMKDYWIFDEASVFEMLYGPDGSFIGSQAVDADEARDVVSWLTAAWPTATPLTDSRREMTTASSDLTEAELLRRRSKFGALLRDYRWASSSAARNWPQRPTCRSRKCRGLRRVALPPTHATSRRSLLPSECTLKRLAA